MKKARAGGPKPPKLEAAVGAMRQDYEHQLDAKYAGARGYVDAILTPEELRPQLAFILKVAATWDGPHLGPFVLTDPLR